LAYDSLEKFALWREANPLAAFAAGAEPTDAVAPDVKMWTSSDSTDAAAPLPAEARPAASPDDVPLPPANPAPAATPP
jgi:hypothetical protein